MMEHIFRNVMDIRMFDVFNCDFDGRDDVDMDEIIEVMEVPYYMRFAVEESVEHLVKQKILQVQNKAYKQYEGPDFVLPVYGTAINQVTFHLYKAVFEHIGLTIEEDEK